MKFDFCIGNPPYQEDRIGDSNTATPVYNSFIDAAYEVSEKTMLITPARFLFNAGYTPKEWNKKMLNNEHLKVVSYMPNSGSVFNGVEIKGGVAVTYRDEQKVLGPIRVFTQYEEVNEILNKVLNIEGFESIMNIVVTSFAYHFTK
nr:Eco57I restriction-modification methylase domain-containing protein [Lachnospiraceae bacterium]